MAAISAPATVVFNAGFMEDGVKLVELPKEISAALKKGQELTIRGSPDDEACLCTDTSTFVVRMVESSNTNLLLPPPADKGVDAAADGGGGKTREVGISAAVTCTYELIPTQPRLLRLKELLAACPYRGENGGGGSSSKDAAGGGGDDDKGGEGGKHDEQTEAGASAKRQRVATAGYTTAELLGLVQASKAELKKGLADLGALEIDGRWRVIDPDYLAEIFDLIISLIIEHGA